MGFDAFIIARHAGDESTGMQALREPREALRDHPGLVGPEAGVFVTAQRACEDVLRYIGKERSHACGKLFGWVGVKPIQHLRSGASHGREFVAIFCAGITRRYESRIGGWT